MWKSVGNLEYSLSDDYYRLVLSVEPELHRYFRALIPKYHVCNIQKYPPHITVVRGETPVNLDVWGRYKGIKAEFEYDSYLHCDGTYWWFNCFSKALTDIRLELGLPASYHLTRPPDGTECFHSTVGNRKVPRPSEK